MFGRRLFSTSSYGDMGKPKGSVLGTAVKVVLTMTAVGSSFFVIGAIRGAHHTLETRKYVDIKLVKPFIPEGRNVIKDQNSASLTKAITESAKLMQALRSQVEATTPEETKKRYSEEASAERKILLNALFFGKDKAEGAKITAEILPYFLNEIEIDSLSHPLTKKWDH